MTIPYEIHEQIADLQQIRDRARQELTHRRLSGRRYHPDLKDFSDLELNQGLTWYNDKIDQLLAPYEKG